MTRLELDIPGASYPIIIGEDLLHDVGGFFDLGRKVLVITDKGVPQQYAEAVMSSCAEPYLFVVPRGENSKSLRWLKNILKVLLDNGFSRSDAIVAVGGGVVGDLAGFAAACYMRGIDWYNVPTTLLSQVDSSVGGKTAVNFEGVKNIVGAFHHPKGVLIDTMTLSTLKPRVFAEGLAEMIKMAATSNAELFSRIETAVGSGDWSDLEYLITEALKIKIDVVSQDPEEKGLRAVLNFGHTIGHAVELCSEGRFYHGEAVAIGMLYMASEPARSRIASLLLAAGLPVEDSCSAESLLAVAAKDKKKGAAGYKTVRVDEIGSFRFETVSQEGLSEIINARKHS